MKTQCLRMCFCAIVVGVWFGSLGLAQDSRRTQQKLPPPVPMNPGPLGPAGYIVLVPIDDRPAVAQFARMIGAIADHQVTMPPTEMLGRFTKPGDPVRIEEWLQSQDYSKVDALVVSVEMLAYGGLVASRTPRTPLDVAQGQLEFFRWFKAKYPTVPVYAFNVIMRVAPTADATNRPWRDKLARWAELQDRVPKTGDKQLAAELEQLKKDLDPKITEDYLAARRRDLRINLAMINLVKEGVVDHLILLQDDARVYGLHRQDQEVLRQRLKETGLESRVPIYNGTDEGSLSLVSRAVLNKFRQSLRVSVIYSSEKSKQLIAPFEDHPLGFTVESQIKASGAKLVGEYDESDYTLYVNAPQTTPQEFGVFLKRMIDELKENKHVALADVLFPAPHHSGADERIVEALKREGLVDKLVGYAAWNTAGNTLGTAIPHANMRVFFRTKLNDRADRHARATVTHLEFLMHRYVDDYLYHDVVRLDLNRRLREEAKDQAATDEFTPEMYARVNREVQDRLRPLAEKFFADYFQGRTHTLAYYNGVKRSVKITGLKGLKIYLPWPRTFEVAVEYKMDYTLI